MARPTLFSLKLGTYLQYAEIGFLILSAIGLILFYSDLSKGHEVILIGLSSLSTIYFLYAFTLPPTYAKASVGRPEPQPDSGSGPSPDASPKGFLDLLPTIARKVIYIASCISIIGLLYEHLKLPGGGQMLLIGGSTLFLSCLLSSGLVVRSNASIPVLRGPLLRGAPILLFVCYWVATHGY